MRICKLSLISAAVLLLGATLFVGCSMQDGSFDDMVYEADNSAIQLSSSFAEGSDAYTEGVDGAEAW